MTTVQKKILFLSAAPFVGGGETNLIALLKTMSSSEFQWFLLYHPKSKMHLYLDGDNLREFDFVSVSPSNVLSVGVMALNFARYLLYHKIDCVYANTIVALKALWSILNFFKIPVLAHIHIDESDEALRWLRIDQAQRIIVCSKFLKNTLLSHSPWLDENKLCAVHNAVDSQVWFPRGKNVLRKEINAPLSVPIIGIVGQLKHIKGQHLFLRMISHLQQEGEDARYVVVGDDNTKNGDYLNFLQTMAKELKVDDVVSFLGYRNDIPEIMSSLDLLICPSLREPFGRVVIEAMACGTPVVASRVGGIVEIFDEDCGGCFFTADDLLSLVEKVKRFLKNKAWWEEQKKIAMEHTRGKFSQSQHTKKIEHFLLEILNEKARVSRTN